MVSWVYCTQKITKFRATYNILHQQHQYLGNLYVQCMDSLQHTTCSSVVVTVLLPDAHFGFCIECCLGKPLLHGFSLLFPYEYLLVLFTSWPCVKRVAGWPVVRLLCRFCVCISVCPHLSHVQLLSTLLPCFSRLRQFRRLLCIAAMSSLPQLRLRDGYREAEATQTRQRKADQEWKCQKRAAKYSWCLQSC